MKFISSLFLIFIFIQPVCASESYFPKGSISSDILREWCERELRIMKEPILKSQKGENEYFAFRVLYLPTWENARAVRIEKNGDHIIKKSVRLTGRSGFESGEISKELQLNINIEEFENLLIKRILRSSAAGLPFL